MKKSTIFLFLTLFPFALQAYPPYAVEINAKQIRDFTYRIDVIKYVELENILVEFTGELFFGDGDSIEVAQAGDKIINYSKRFAKTINRFEHTFPGPGTYHIVYKRNARDREVINAAPEARQYFYIDALLVIDPITPQNNLPQFISPPLSSAEKDQPFQQYHQAYDPDGDSLSYEIIPCKLNEEEVLPGYVLPTDPTVHFGESVHNPFQFSIDPVSGLLNWNYPYSEGVYAFCIKVQEWKKYNQNWEKGGYIIRDVMVYVDDSKDQSPIVQSLPDTFLLADQEFKYIINAKDPDNDIIQVVALGEPFLLNNALAQTDPIIGEGSNQWNQLEFSWNPTADLVRNKPYVVEVFPIDFKFSPLKTVQRWNLWVVDEVIEIAAPENLQMTERVEGNYLVWQDNADNETYFEVEASRDGTDFKVIGQTAEPEFLLDNVYCNDQMFFRVRAINLPFKSDPSNIVSGIVSEADLRIFTQSGSLNAPKAEAYRWFLEETQLIPQTQSIAPLTSGVYQVELTDALGCNRIVANNQVVTGLSEDTDHLLIYPNPVSDWLNLNLPEPTLIKIFNLQGVLHQQTRTNHKLDVSGLPAGSYFLLVEGSIQQSFRFIKK